MDEREMVLRCAGLVLGVSRRLSDCFAFRDTTCTLLSDEGGLGWISDFLLSLALPNPYYDTAIVLKRPKHFPRLLSQRALYIPSSGAQTFVTWSTGRCSTKVQRILGQGSLESLP